MELSFSFPWEALLIQWLQAHMGPAAVTLAAAVTLLGDQLATVGILGFLYWCWDKEYGRFVGLNLVAASLWNPMVKNLVLRRRPYFDLPGVRCLKPVEPDADLYDLHAQGYSFPSGHSTGAAATYVSLPLYRRRRRLTAAAVVIPFLVGLSRVCLGVHYPTDVLAGWALGLLAVFLLSLLQKRISRRGIFAILLLSGLPGWFFCHNSDFYSAYGLLLGFAAATAFEEKYVRFENTRVPWRCVLRMAGGVAVYLGLNALLKLPFDRAFLASDGFLPHLVRALRYAVVAFADIGVYPLAFRPAGERREPPPAA